MKKPCKKILEVGTNSEIEKLEKSDIEDDTSNNTVIPAQLKIGEDLEQPDPSDLLANKNDMKHEKTVSEVDGETLSMTLNWNVIKTALICPNI